MKKYIIAVFLFFCLTKFNKAQQISVIDKTTLQSIPGTIITDITTGKTITSNAKGEADISSLSNSDSIKISYVGYQTLVLSYQQIISNKNKIYLSEKLYSLGEIVVSANRFEEKKEDIPTQIQLLKGKDISFMNQPSTAEIISQSGNVLVQKSQMGGGSPIIRGFEANKVLLVVDGVRMNNAIYRGGHLQNIITVNNSILDKVEVIFGAGSVVYGSDALGGVMHFYTQNPILSTTEGKTKVTASAFTRYSTAANENSANLNFNIGGKKIGFLTSISYSKFGDLHQGDVRNPFYGDWGKRLWYVERFNNKDSMVMNDNKNIQKFSGYSQMDIFEKILFKQSDHLSHIINLQYSTSSDIPRYDRLTELSGGKPKFAEWYYGPQKRLFAAYTLSYNKINTFMDHLNLILSYQDIEESRYDRKFNKNIKNCRIENVKVVALNFDMEKRFMKNEIRYGVEGNYNKVTSNANIKDIIADTTGPLDTRYPDGGSLMNSMAVYITHTYELNPKFIITDGIRFSYVTMDAKFEDTTFYNFPFRDISQKNNALNGNIGFVYMPGMEWRFALLGSSGFRAPNVDDLSKVFESVPGNIIVPNPDLKPEYTYNGELTIGKGFNNMVYAEGVGYYTIYKNAITTKPSKYNGLDSIIYNGQMSLVTSNTNALEAYIYGASVNLKADITTNFSVSSFINYTYGRIKTDTTDYPLDHIPPVFGKTSFELKLKKFRTEFFILYHGWKYEKDYNKFGEDNFASATPYGMPAWFTLNIRSAYQFTKNIQLHVGLENLLNQNYRVFASGINAPGRNLIVTIKGNF